MHTFIHYLVRGIQFLAFLCVLTFLLKADRLPNSHTLLDQSIELSTMKRAYERSRPIDMQSSLSSEQATLINAMIYLFDESLYVSFPRYNSSLTYLEFDSLVNQSFTSQTDLYREEFSEIHRDSNRYSTYIIIGVAVLFITLLLQKYALKKSK